MENHTINIDDRQHMVITAVTDIDSFDEETVYVALENGSLILRGTGFHIQSLDLGEGKTVITGLLDTMEYAKTKEKDGRSLFKKIFK